MGPGVPSVGVYGTGVSQPWGCGPVVLGGDGPPLSGPSSAQSAVYGPRAGYCVCRVRGSVGEASWACCGPGAALLGGEWWCVAVGYGFHGVEGGYLLGCGVGPW